MALSTAGGGASGTGDAATDGNPDGANRAGLGGGSGSTLSVFTNDGHGNLYSNATLNVGSVLINDLIVPTADPRVPFGGRPAPRGAVGRRCGSVRGGGRLRLVSPPSPVFLHLP